MNANDWFHCDGKSYNLAIVDSIEWHTDKERRLTGATLKRSTPTAAWIVAQVCGAADAGRLLAQVSCNQQSAIRNQQ